MVLQDASNAAEEVVVDVAAEDLVAPRAEEDANQPPVAMDEGAGPEAAGEPVAAPDELSRTAVVGDGEGQEAEQGDSLLGAVGGVSEADKVESGELEREDLWMKMLRDENGKEETRVVMVHRSKGKLDLLTDSVAEVEDGELELRGNLVRQLVLLDDPPVKLTSFKSRMEAELLVDITASESGLPDDRHREPELLDSRHREPEKQDDIAREGGDKTCESAQPVNTVREPDQLDETAREPVQPDIRDREPVEQDSTAREPEQLEETAREQPAQPDNRDREPAQPDNTAREPEQPLPAFVEAAVPAEANNLPPGPDADPDVAPPVPPRPNRPLQGLGDAHQAMMQGGGPTGFQPYTRPDLFPLRVS